MPLDTAALTAALHGEYAWFDGNDYRLRQHTQPGPGLKARLAGFDLHLNPTFDHQSRTQGENDFWIEVIDVELEQTIACQAVCFYDDRTLNDLCATGNLWYDMPPDNWSEVSLDNLDSLKTNGAFAHTGAMNIHPAFRKSGARGRGAIRRLSTHLVRVMRMTALLKMPEIAWWTGLIREGTLTEDMLANVYMAHHSEVLPLTYEAFPPLGMSTLPGIHMMEIGVSALARRLITGRI